MDIRNASRKHGGFSLLEMIAVVVIIGVLAAILVPNLKGSREDAKTARAQADLKVIQSGVETYILKHNAFPTLTNLTAETLAKRVVNKTGPDPFSATDADYQLITSGTYPDTLYAVISVGPDGVAAITATGLSDGTLTSGEKVDDIYATNAKH